MALERVLFPSMASSRQSTRSRYKVKSFLQICEILKKPYSYHIFPSSSSNMFIPKSILGLWLATHAYSWTPCPLLGQSVEPPTNLTNVPAVQEAFANLRATLKNSTATGLTDYGSWSPTNNSFSIGIFDATTPGQLFSYQHSSEALEGAEKGVKNVTENSIYRIGSVSKLITVYLFLTELGPKYWNRPVTEFVPRLKQAAENCSASEDSADCADWDAITLGSLASHMAGIGRDCKTGFRIVYSVDNIADYNLRFYYRGAS